MEAACVACATVVLLFAARSSAAQGMSTASRAGDLQIGGGFTTASSGYSYAPDRISGFAFYSDFNFWHGLGVELEFHQLDEPNSAVYERTYEAGAQYVHPFGRLTPYAKGLYGRGVLNFPKNVANLGYNLLAGGGGIDFAVTPRINVRGDFEYQYWMSAPGGGLHISPGLATIGVAYHFGPGVAH